ncbi:hypothetical protein [Corynebacterium heidelbergense]|uniref:Uncharacterized protein n=1 Tax=Corynebacterium heidelbergense TaxID=2055947 RepID=A0A364VC80_9CORY|nr:hypothetical protein [Corynebacterium heidelbergense]RAV34234.1 hypothetical protein CWC39_04330 [Corynebacterium heidelbergense]WCZ35782.1 hypothetical protein CHEID_01020 [Corynebacterium heidelbergense]
MSGGEFALEGHMALGVCVTYRQAAEHLGDTGGTLARAGDARGHLVGAVPGSWAREAGAVIPAVAHGVRGYARDLAGTARDIEVYCQAVVAAEEAAAGTFQGGIGAAGGIGTSGEAAIAHGAGDSGGSHQKGGAGD